MNEVEGPKFNFSSTECTCNDLAKQKDLLIRELYRIGCESIQAASDVKSAEAALSLQIRNSGVKVTEGYVSSAIDADTDIVALRLKADKKALELSCVRNDLTGIHDDYRMFNAWMESQNAAGIRG